MQDRVMDILKLNAPAGSMEPSLQIGGGECNPLFTQNEEERRAGVSDTPVDNTQQRIRKYVRAESFEYIK